MPGWLKNILTLFIPVIIRKLFGSNAKLPKPIEMSDDIWDERRETKSN